MPPAESASSQAARVAQEGPNLLQVPASWVAEQVEEDRLTLEAAPAMNDVRVPIGRDAAAFGQDG